MHIHNGTYIPNLPTKARKKSRLLLRNLSLVTIIWTAYYSLYTHIIVTQFKVFNSNPEECNRQVPCSAQRGPSGFVGLLITREFVGDTGNLLPKP